MENRYIDAEKLILLIDAKLEDLGMSGSVWVGRSVLQELKNDITSLQYEQPELPDNLDEAAQKVEDYYDVAEECGYLCCHRGDIKDAFKAGAEWMARQMKQEQP